MPVQWSWQQVFMIATGIIVAGLVIGFIAGRGR
jgi:hypothetical protein